MRFIGPVFESPLKGGTPAALDDRGAHVLVTLGTHLEWAKSRALEVVRDLARQRPDWTFHFSRGQSGGTGVEVHGNLHVHDYIPYDDLNGYRCALVHGGAGIVYACLAHGLPMVVWPHDYDQFDNAARVVAAGAGVRTKGTARSLLRALDLMDADPLYRTAASQMQAELRAESPAAKVSALLMAR